MVALCAVGLIACGDDGPRYSDGKIIDKLNLEPSEDGSGYEMRDDRFCELSKQLLNDADEIGTAKEEATLDLIVTSREGNVGIEGLAPFASPCPDVARKKLSRLDPQDKD